MPTAKKTTRSSPRTAARPAPVAHEPEINFGEVQVGVLPTSAVLLDSLDEPLPLSYTVDSIDKAILAVMEQVGYVRKRRSPNAGVSYAFAGERDLIAAIRPWMVQYGIIVSVEDVTDVAENDYETKGGGRMHAASATVTFRLTHAPSGTSRIVKDRGEGADVSDKSNGKLMTYAYKNMLRRSFCIETGEDPDQFQPTVRARSDPKPVPHPDSTQMTPEERAVVEKAKQQRRAADVQKTQAAVAQMRTAQDVGPDFDAPATPVTHGRPAAIPPKPAAAPKPADPEWTNPKKRAQLNIRTKAGNDGFQTWLKKFAETFPAYQEKDGKPNQYHVLGAMFAADIKLVDDANYQQAFQKIAERARNKAAAAAITTHGEDPEEVLRRAGI
jgi:hypothetical protein